MQDGILLVQQKVKIPFTIAISFIFSLASLMVTSGALVAIGIEWLSGVFALTTTLLFSITWPSSMLAVFGKVLDDRSMSVDEVARVSQKTMPVGLLRSAYIASAIILHASLGLLLLGASMSCVKCTGVTSIPRAGSLGALGICEADGDAPLLLCASIAGSIASLVVMNIQRHKLRYLMWTSAVPALAFTMLALGLALWKVLHGWNA
jgi:hypothetical protein